MSGLAMFGLKYPSLLKFDEAYQAEAVIRANLKMLYGVERAPCETQLRTILDPVDPAPLRPAFRAVQRHLQRHKALEAYQYLDGQYVVSLDGTGQFASRQISCPDWGVKPRQGQTSYYHQLLGAVFVHPELPTVLPVAPEAITRQDGTTKNDCERTAAKRLLKQLRRDHPTLPLIVVEASLAANGPHLELRQELNLRYLIGVKAGDHAALFAAVEETQRLGTCAEWAYTDEAGGEHRSRFVNDLALNKSHPHLRVNFLEYWATDGAKQLHFRWIPDLELRFDTIEPIMRGGRARWKIENEPFNTLKNQGYCLEHNYGHGQQHLATVFAMLMMLAFLGDQTQELGCRLFQAARARFRSRTSLWEKLRSLFTTYYIRDWPTLWAAILSGHQPAELQPDTS
jgi:hypothetical protein